MKNTNYSELKNLSLAIRFNQSKHQDGFQPVEIEARADALTTEGAIRNVSSRFNIGDVVETPLTNEEIYKQVYGISKVLATALKEVLLEGIDQDVSAVDVTKISPIETAHKKIV